jgi:hypothetical protein
MKKSLIIAWICVLSLLFFSQSLSAIPAFARKYGFNCNMCHVAFPKLNDFGQRLRDNGYQIPGQAGLEKSVFETGVPISMRTSTGYTTYSTEQGSTAGFHVYGLDVLAAGVLHKNISFFFVYTPRIDVPAADFSGPRSGGKNPSQLAAIESANVVFSNLIQDKLNLRIGRFEPAYQLLSSKRLYYLLQSYETYGFVGGQNSFDFSANQLGVEATGRFKHGFKYSLGFVNGSAGNPDNNTSRDFYLILSKTFGPGEGQSAGQRIGLFGYLGWQPTILTDVLVSPLGDGDGQKSQSFNRLGGDLSLNWKTFNLQAMAFRGVDNKVFNNLNPVKNYSFWGGVVKLDWASLANNRLVASLMYNWVRPPSEDNSHRLKSFSALIRTYLGSWYAVNVALHAEYTRRTLGAVSLFKEDVLTLLLDFAF